MLTLNNQELFFIWDCLEDRRNNCLDLIDSDASLDAGTMRELLDTANDAGRLQDLLIIAMED